MAKTESKDGRAPEGSTAETADAAVRLSEAALALGKAPKVAPKLKAEAALLPPDIVEQAAVSYFEKVRENWQVIAAGSLVVIVAVLFANWQIESGRTRNRTGQEQFRHAMTAGADGQPSREKLEEVVASFGGTQAQPMALLAIGDLDAKKGDQASLGKAVETYERVLRDFAKNPIVADIARRSLERTKKAAAFDAVKRAAEKGEKVEWAKGESVSAVPGPAPAAPAPAPAAPVAPAPAPK